MARILRQPKDRVLAALVVVALMLFADLAVSSGYLSSHQEDLPLSHGMMMDVDPPEIHRSKTFPRLGSVALNLTACLHDTSTDAAKGFTCAHDLYDAYFGAHGNGDHNGNLYRHFSQYFEQRFLNDRERFEAQGIHSGHDLEVATLGAHGMDEQTYLGLCAAKGEPLADARDLPDALSALPMSLKVLASSLCRYAPFYEDPAAPENAFWQAEYEEEDPDHSDHLDHEAADPADAFGDASGDAADPLALSHAAEGHGHMGPHGLDFNTETNWVYTALSHQGKVAIINLNVVDWGKVASYEERTGYRVLLFDDEAVFDPTAVLHYASELLRENLGQEEAFAKSVDAVHRYCFSENLAAFNARGGQVRDNVPFPGHLDPELSNALAFFAAHSAAPTLRPGGEMPAPHSGFACFFAFTGIAARSWTDPEFMNPFCTFDTRHLAKHDARLSPGQYSRMNVQRQGAGDAWRCDWFIRYLEVTSDITLQVRRAVPIDLAADFPQLVEGHVQEESPAVAPPPGMEYVEFPVNVTIGPHDVTYNPVNGLLYVTHYWELNDPDVRLLPDWTIHLVDGNPASPAFNNPWKTKDGVPLPSKNGAPGGSAWMDSKPYPVDVGGPVDGLHPMSSEVDVTTGRVFIANRESNTISVLFHDGSRDFATDKASVVLKGPTALAMDVDLDRSRPHERDWSLYRDPDNQSAVAGERMGGWFDFSDVVATGRCGPIEEQAAADPLFGQNLSQAIDQCRKGLVATRNLGNESIGETARPALEALVRGALDEAAPWPLLLKDFRQVLSAPQDEYPGLAARFKDRWLPMLPLPADRAFLEDAVDGFPLVSPGNRTQVAMETFALAEARWWGRTGPLVEDLVAFAPLLRTDVDFDQKVAALVAKYAASAADGSLLGYTGATLEVGQVEAIVRAVEPAVSASLLTGTPLWLAYCVSYSADDWVFHLVQGENPWTARGKEADNGLHPFHCDDVTKIHYPKPTPIQSDFAGVSNHHAVVIVREPVGPLLMDYWFEARPRILQPFDLWFNAGDRTLYVSNFGNHDNVPLLRGWIAPILEGGVAKCHSEKPMHEGRLVQSELLDPVLDTVARLIPKTSCVLPKPRSGFSANLLLDMDLMPHHINVNPYTFEVYGGHLLSDYVMVAQLEQERVEWAIPRAHVFGSDVVGAAAQVPNPNPTGMGVNPSTQRLFTSHFMQSKLLPVPLTGRTEDVSRYVTPIDLRNYTLMPDMVYAGDHHVSVDLTRPPGTGAFDFPFYNRSRTLAISGQPVLGHMVAVGDSSTAYDVFWRCTYYRVQLDRERVDFASPVDGMVVRAPYNASNQFSGGRCFNLFDLQPQLKDNAELLGETTSGDGLVFKDNTTDRVFWEVGAEHLSFGQLNLFFDPDNVPASLRVRAPHARDHDDQVGIGVQATEELASMWAESDTGPVAVPQGEVVLKPAAKPTRAASAWTLEFDTKHQVEFSGRPPPARPDEMTLTVSADVGATRVTAPAGDWWSGAASGKEWVETRVPLRKALGGAPASPVTATFRFDSKDAEENGRAGWTVAGLSLELPDGTPVSSFNLSDLPGFQSRGMVSRLPVVDPEDPARLVPSVGFRDAATGTYENGTEPATGEFAFTFDAAVQDPVLVVLHRQDVEPAREWSQPQPYDQMIVEASADGGLTWHEAWRRDSRDAPVLDWTRQRVDVSALVNLASGAWHDANRPEWEARGYALPAAERDLLFRLRFDALDPAANDLPGWRVKNLVLRHGASPAEDRPLVVHSGAVAPAALGPIPRWWQDADGTLAFTNAHLTYATPGGEGGADGTLCRVAHGRFGAWGAGYQRGSGSGALSLVGRDLAGETTRLLHQDGRGPALVADSFQSAGFTESYWAREEDDPSGVGHPAYVFDPTPEGQGDLVPEDTPVEYGHAGGSVVVDPSVGETVRAPRGLLVERPPHASNFFVEETELVTEASALVDDGVQYRRAFVLTPAEADGERLAPELRDVLHQEQTFLNATHVALKRQPEPVKVTLKQLDNLVKKVVTQDEHAKGFDLDAVLAEFLRSAKMAAQLGQNHGMRDQATDDYVLDGTRDLPTQATERLTRPFLFSREANAPASLDLQVDFVARHRFEDTIVKSKPTLPRLDPGFLEHLLTNVTIEKLNMTRDELEKVTGRNNLTNQTYDDVAWRSTHTLADVGVDAARLVNQLVMLGENALAIDVPVSEILNDLDRAQMSLPTFGEAYGVRVLLRAPSGQETVLASRDGAGLSRWSSMAPGQVGSDVRVTLLPGATPGAYEVALGTDAGRFEKVRLHLDAAQAATLLPESGTYELVLESTIRGGDAPAPGVAYEIAYSDLELRVGLDGAGNELPDAGFTWPGPVTPGVAVPFLPAAHPQGLARLGDQDGHLARYRWTFPAGATSVKLNGVPLAADADGSPRDDALTNVRATLYGSLARNLTWDPAARVLQYEASGCRVPVPSAAFSSGQHAVTLAVTDDGGASRTLTQTVQAGGPRRAPEMLVDPWVEDGVTQVAWQDNPGSLLLNAKGRALNLTQWIDMVAGQLTLDQLKNRTVLETSLQIPAGAEITKGEVLNASVETRVLLNATLNGTLPGLPDLLLDWLLVRPGTVRVVAKDAEDAANGTRVHVLLGQMPENTAFAIPLLADLLNGDVGVPELPDGTRLAKKTLRDPASAVAEACAAARPTGLCDAGLDDVRKLLDQGLLDSWTLRFAIHPEKNGAADTNVTLAQIVVMDTGVGVLYLLALDVADEAGKMVDDTVNLVEDDLQGRLAGVDPIVPITPYVALLSALQQEANNVSFVVPAAAGLRAQLLHPAGLLPGDDLGLQQALGVSLQAVDDQEVRQQELLQAIERSRNASLSYVQKLRAVQNATLGEAQAELALWPANVVTDASLGPAREGWARFGAQGNASLDNATLAIEQATEGARRIVRDLHEATNTTRWLAMDWTEALLRRDPDDLQARFDSILRNVSANVNDVANDTASIYENVTGFVDRTTGAKTLTYWKGDVSHESLVIGYDSATNRASLRIGDAILREATLKAPPASRVYPSLTFSSIGNRTAEVQALWGGKGATLRDGFNRDADLVGSRFAEQSLGKANTTGDARAAILQSVAGPDPSRQVVWASRSAEGWTARHGLKDFSNQHRFATDALSSPPSVAGRAPFALPASADAARLPAQLPAFVQARLDQPHGYQAALPIPPGALQEVRVASGANGPRSAPAIFTPPGPPPAPFVFDARDRRFPNGTESLQVAFQPVGASDPAISSYEVWVARRPDVGDDTSRMAFLGSVGAQGNLTLDPGVGDAKWLPGKDFVVFETKSPAWRDDWRYVQVRAVNARGAGAFSAPHRVPPSYLDESFSLLREGQLTGPNLTVDAERGDVDLTLWGLGRVKLDTCLGDRVEVTRWDNYPHDEDAARWARSLRVQERGLDSVFSILRQLDRNLNELPLNFLALDGPLNQQVLDGCPSLRSLVDSLDGLADPTVLEGLDLQVNWTHPLLNPNATVGGGDFSVVGALHDVGRQLLGNASLNLSVGDLVHGTPATVTWRTAEAEGPYYARTRFMVPGPHLGPLTADTSLDRLLPNAQVGLLNALIPGERFHLLQLGHEDADGTFTETLRVDFDPHLLAPVDVEQTAQFVDDVASQKKDVVGALVTGDLPLGYGLVAGDTAESRELIGSARPDRWNTLEVFAPEKDAEVYSVALNGQMVGQFRTSSPIPPNALRLGGSHVPTEVLFDDVRFMPALHPPAPVAQAVPLQESFDFAAIRYHVPEHGGAPLTDFNLLRRDLDRPGEAPQVVATAASGHVRVLTDPLSHGDEAGRRFAYSVQAVNGLRGQRNAGPASSAHAITLPGFLRVSGDVAVPHVHTSDVRDAERHEGEPTLTVGGAGAATWRAFFQVNASQAVDARGNALDPTTLGAATFMAYNLRQADANSGKISELPTLEEVLATLGYNHGMAAEVGATVTFHDAQEAAGYLRLLDPSIEERVTELYGDDAYAEMLQGMTNETLVSSVITCPDIVPRLVGHGFECRDAEEEPMDHVSMCDDFARDLETEEQPFNCWNDAIGGYVLGDSAFDTRTTTWRTQPDHDFHRLDVGVMRQSTRDSMWRRYDLLPSLLRDGEGDVTLALRKQKEQPISGQATYAATEGALWLDDSVNGGRGAADRRGPDDFPWSKDEVGSGRVAAKVGGHAGLSTLKLTPTGLTGVPLDVPMKVRVFIPEGSSPRELGIRVSGTVGLKPVGEQPTSGRDCGVYGAYGGGLVTWGDELVSYQGGQWVVDDDGELDHAADLLHPRERFTGHHVAGVPPVRGKWVTLTWDPGHAALEASGLVDPQRGLVTSLLNGLKKLRGPETNLWLPEHLAEQGGIYERQRPLGFVERVDHVDPRFRDQADPFPYDYFIPEWLFLWQNYDDYIEPWHCELKVTGMEFFVVGGTVYLDRVGPDLEPRVRLDVGGGSP